MIYLLEGADHYGASANILKKWSGGGVSLASGRHGDGIFFSYVNYVIPTTTMASAVGVAYKIPEIAFVGDIIQLGDTGTGALASLQKLPDGRVRAASMGFLSPPTSGVVLRLGGFCYLELSVVISVADPGPPIKYQTSYVIRLNGGYVAGSGVLGPGSLSNPNINMLTFLGGTADDIYWTDGAMLGDCHMRSRMPTNDGSYGEYTPSTPGSHYPLVNEVPPDLTTYLQATAVGQREVHTFPTSDDDEIAGVQSCLYVGASGGLSKLKPMLRIGGADYLGAEVVAADRYALQAWEVSPDTGLPFTKTELSGMEMGSQTTG